MVSSSLDKNIKNAKDSCSTTVSLTNDSLISTNNINSNNLTNNNLTRACNNFVGGVNDSNLHLPSSEKIQMLFPKCKPKTDYKTPQDTSSSSPKTTITANNCSNNLISIDSTITTSSSSSTSLLSNKPQLYNNTQQSNNSSCIGNTSFNLSNSKLLKLQPPISPSKKQKQQQNHLISQFNDDIIKGSSLKNNCNKNSYIETNPFRINSNNRYFYTSNDSLFNNNNSNNVSSTIVNNSCMMQQQQQPPPTQQQQQHYNCPPLSHRNYQHNTNDDRDYYFEPDEVEHNPYVIESMKNNISSTMNTIPSSILKTTPPATPPALTMSPIDSSPLSNRNMWDLSPIKTTTPTRIKTQSPINMQYPRSNRGSYKKLLASPVPIEEDLETGHVYNFNNSITNTSNNKKYYQMENNSNEFTSPLMSQQQHERGSDMHESLSTTMSSTVSKMKCNVGGNISSTTNNCNSKQLDYMYDDFKIKDERRMVKSKSGSGIMEYDGSPRRFGMSSNEDIESQSQQQQQQQQQQSYKMNLQGTISPNSSPPRPGFPQRILTHHQQYSTRSKSPIDCVKKSYSYDSAMSSISSYPSATQKLLPTTFISNKPYSSSTSQEKTQTIDEESESTNVDDDEMKPDEITKQPEAPQSHYLSSDISHAFQVTSPTEETMPTSTFDYLYEFSETRKVLEEFFKVPDTDKIKELEKFSDFNESDDSLDIQYDYRGQIEKEIEDSLSINKQQQNSSMNTAVATTSSINQMNDIDDDNRDDKEDEEEEKAYMKTKQNGFVATEMKENNKSFDYLVDSGSRSSLGDENVDQDNDVDNFNHKRTRRMSKSSTNNNYTRRLTKNFNYSPDTTDYDSNYGDYDFESENSLRYLTADYTTQQAPTSYAATTSTLPTATVDLSGGPNNTAYSRYSTSMSVFPKLEDGLSSGHASDNENNNPAPLDINFYNKRNNISSSISTIQKQYQESLAVQNQAKVSGNSNINNSTSTLFNNNNVLNNNDETQRSTIQQPTTVTTTTNSSHACYPPPTTRRDNNKDNISRFNASNVVGTAVSSSASHISTNNKIFKSRDPELESLYTINTIQLNTPPPPAPVPHRQQQIGISSPLKQELDLHSSLMDNRNSLQACMNSSKTSTLSVTEVSQTPTTLYSTSNMGRNSSTINETVESPTLQLSPVWIPRSHDKKSHSPILHHEDNPLLSKGSGGGKINSDDEDEEEIDTDLETDRLLGHQMLDDGFYDDKAWNEAKQLSRAAAFSSKISPKVNQLNPSNMMKSKTSNSSSLIRHGLNTLLPTTSSSDCCMNSSSPSMLNTTTTPYNQSRSLKTSPSLNLNSGNLVGQLIHTTSNEASPDRQNIDTNLIQGSNDLKDNLENKTHINNNDSVDLCNLDNLEIGESPGSSSEKSKSELLMSGDKKKKNKNKEVLIEGVLFRARYLGSTQLVCEGQPTKSTRMMQAEEAVSRIKALAPDGENQPSTEVDLFISTEKIMVLNTDLKEIMMDHALRTISYIADIGDLVVLMARRRFVPQDVEANSDSGTGTGGSGNVSGGSGGPTPPTSGKINRTPKMICHVFESEEAQFIAQSIGQAFQVAYMEFLKANGIEDHSFMKEMDYQEVLNSQEIFGDELEIFAKKELQKEVVVPKAKGEILGVVIVESGWGSMLPTVVIANLAPNGAAARCGHLNIGDQIIAINGLSLVGLPLSQCQSYIKNTKNQTVVKFTVVPCAPVVEVKIKRPNTKYQLGFSVQNGVICSLLRGGIAERGGVRVGHRIIEINNQSVVAVPHEKIVNLLATSVGEIHMKTMPTSMFRLLTGQENPIYI